MHQECEYPQHVTGTQLQNSDFAALASAYGFAGVRLTHAAELEPALSATTQTALKGRLEAKG